MFKSVFFYIFFISVSSSFLFAQPPLGAEFTGKASFYHQKFHGRKTSSGEIMQAQEFTCAHPSFPFGTMLEITNLKNKKWCVVRVNDRGPYGGGRLLDVSYAAAEELGMVRDGVAKVKVMVVGKKGEIEIANQQAIVENTSDIITLDEPKEPVPQVPLKPAPPKPKPKKKPTKSLAKKRKQRRK